MAEAGKSAGRIYATPLRLLIVTAASVFSAEAVVMALLYLLPPQPVPLEALLDASILTLITIPMLYLFLFRPMRGYLAGIKAAEDVLQREYAEVEARVRERTAELSRSNEAILSEMAERRRAEEELTLFKDLINKSGEAIFLIDPGTGHFLDVNDKACSSLGYAREEMIRMGVEDIEALLPGDFSCTECAEEVRRTGAVVKEVAHRRKDGAVFPVELSITCVRRGSGDYIVAVAHDITARKAALEANERQMRRLTALRSIDMAISSSLDLRVSLNIILGEAVEQLKVHAADILLYNRHLKTLEFAAGRGFRTGALQHTKLPIGESFAGRAALERRMVHISDFKSKSGEFRRSQEMAEEGFALYYGVPLIAKGDVKGVLEIFHRLPLEPSADWLDFLDALAGEAAIALDNAELFEGLQSKNTELTVAYDVTIEGWSRALDLRDKETEGHSRRVTEMTLLLARRMGIRDEELAHLRRGALLHDIGKMGVPDAILLKPGPLTDKEWESMRMHPVYAYELLSPIEFLRPAIVIPYCHHEKWDGTGYPRGLKGDRIPLGARIFAAVDVYDAITSDRPYRPAFTADKAYEHVRSLAGSHLDPKVAEVFLRMKAEV